MNQKPGEPSEQHGEGPAIEQAPPGGDEPKAGELEEVAAEAGEKPATDIEEDAPEPEQAERGPADTPAPDRRRPIQWPTLLALALAVLAAGLAGWVAFQQDRVGNLTTASTDQLISSLGNIERGLDTLEGKIAGLEQDQAEVQSGLDRVQRELQAELDRSQRELQAQLDREAVSDRDVEARIATVESALAGLRGDVSSWQRAEAEHLLRIANQSLTLVGDVRTAAAALRAADDKLRGIGDPSLSSVRASIARELQALEATRVPDVEGLALKLGSLAASVARLPLKSPLPDAEQTNTDASAEPEGSVDRALSVVGDAFGSLFSVRKVESEVTPLLLPEEEYFLRRNLELQLQTARLALLDGAEVNFRESIRTAHNWLAAYFDDADPAVEAALESLDEMENETIRASLPDISGSLALLVSLSPEREGGP